MGIVFEKLTLVDIEAVIEVENQLYFRPWSEGSFVYACDHYISWVLRKEQAFVGYAICDQIDEEIQLLNFSIAPMYQNQGIGQQALRQFLALCYDSLGGQMIYLEVNASNHVAIHLYKKQGFLPMGRRLGYYTTAEGREDAITMYHSKQMLIA